MSTAAMMGKVLAIPRDRGLDPRAVKVARRIQGLEDGRTYHLTITKEADRWTLAVYEPVGVKTEVVR